MSTAKDPLDWVTGCYEPAFRCITKVIADMPINAEPEAVAVTILNRLADINITVEFIDGPHST